MLFYQLRTMPKSILIWIIFISLTIDALAAFNAYIKYNAPSQNLPKVLLAGFEPFDGRDENASWEAIESWKNRRHDGLSYRTLKLPVDYEKSTTLLEKALGDWQPNVILLFSEHPTTETIRIETTARGDDGTKLGTRLPSEKLKEAYGKAGINAVLSNHAGNFVSNYTFYYLINYLENEKHNAVIAGEIHLPLVNQYGFSKQVLGDVVAITVKVLLN